MQAVESVLLSPLDLILTLGKSVDAPQMKTLLLVLAITALAVGYNVLLVSQGPSLHKAIHGPDAKTHKSTPTVR